MQKECSVFCHHLKTLIRDHSPRGADSHAGSKGGKAPLTTVPISACQAFLRNLSYLLPSFEAININMSFAWHSHRNGIYRYKAEDDQIKKSFVTLDILKEGMKTRL